MWVFSRSSFLSIISDDDDAAMLVVRARMRGDIHGLWPKATVDWTPKRDYAYRTRLRREEVAAALAREVCAINYSNYKSTVAQRDARRAPFYAWVWSIMADAGDSLEGREAR